MNDLDMIVLKLRLAKTRFDQRIGGAADFSYAQTGTLNNEFAFVVPLAEVATPNDYDPAVNQLITEAFAIIVALKNDTTQSDKLGFISANSIGEVRAEIFKGILGWQMPDAESLIYYTGGNLLNVDRAWLWWEFNFEVAFRATSEEDGVGLSDHLIMEDGTVSGEGTLPWFLKIYAQYKQAPYSNPTVDGWKYPIANPDMTQFVNLSVDPNAGSFGIGWGYGYDKYLGGS